MRRLIIALVVALLAGCASGPWQQTQDDTLPGRVAPQVSSSEQEGELPGFDDEEVTGGIEGTEFYTGTAQFIDEDLARQRAPAVTADGEIVLNFEGESIQSVIHTVLGEVMQENFVIGPGVSGQVTFSTARPVTQDQLMPILEMLLRWNGATMVWMDDRWHILPVSDAVAGNLTPGMGDLAAVRGYEVHAFPLKYTSAVEMQKILEPYARQDAILNVDAQRNMLFMAGTREELANYHRTIDIFDVDWLSGMSVGIYPLESVEVEAITTELSAIFGAEGESPLAGMIRFVPLERLGSVMVITPQPEYLERAENWINTLDRGAAGGGQRLFVYKVRNLEAPVLANYLIQLYGGTASEPRERRDNTLAPGLQPVTVGSVGDFNQNRAQANRAGVAGGGGNRSGGGTASFNTGEGDDVRITAVTETNSLIIQATQSQYDSIRGAIERIDEEPLQVLIEAQVLNVALNEDLQYGVSWFISNNPEILPEDFVGFNPAGRYVDTAQISGSGFLTNLIRPITGDSTFVQATITALDQVTDVRSLAAPSLLVRNNSEATITVGEQVPVQSSSINTGGIGNVVSSAQYVSTGVTLRVTPRINPGGLVYLDITQDISRPGERNPDISLSGNPPISNQSVTSQVAVQSGATVFLGGLITEQSSEGTSGLPYLSRMPLIGPLFGSRVESGLRSETIVMITPTVLESAADLESASREMEEEFTRVKPINIATLQGNGE